MSKELEFAKTILERTDAELMFSNGRDEQSKDKINGYQAGAIVTVSWMRKAIEQPIGALGQNQVLEI